MLKTAFTHIIFKANSLIKKNTKNKVNNHESERSFAFIVYLKLNWDHSPITL